MKNDSGLFGIDVDEMMIVFDILKSVFEHCSEGDLRELLCISRRTFNFVFESFYWNIKLVYLCFHEKKCQLKDIENAEPFWSYIEQSRFYNFTNGEFRFLTKKRYEQYKLHKHNLHTCVMIINDTKLYLNVDMESITDSVRIRTMLIEGIDFFNNPFDESRMKIKISTYDGYRNI
jgi:hypothetical protein